MNLGIKNRIEKWVLSKAGKHFPALFREWEEQYGIPQDADAERYAKTYSVAIWAYACIRALSEACASVPLKFYKQSQKEKIEVTSGDIYNLFSDVNDFISCADLIEATVAYLQLNGNAYWLIEDGDFEIFPLRPERVRIVPDKKEFIKGYLYTVPETNQTIRFEKDEILHFKLFHGSNDYYGLSPLAVAKRTLTTEFYAQTANINLFKNAIRPGGVVEIEGKLDDPSYKRLQGEWEKAHKGVGKWHKLILLEGGAKWHETYLKMKDAEFTMLKKLNREEICACFKIPPAIVGIFEYANYANSQEQLKMFWQHAVIPTQKKIINTLNENYIKRRDDGKDVLAEFDLSDVKILQKDEKQIMEILTGYVDRNIITVNEARKDWLYMPPVEWGDEKQERLPTIVAEAQKILNSQFLKTVPIVPEPLKQIENKKLDYTEKEFETWKKFDEELSVDEKKFKEIMVQYLKDQKERVLKNLQEIPEGWLKKLTKKYRKKIEKGQNIKLSDSDLDRLFDYLKEEGLLTGITAPIFLSMIEKIGRRQAIEIAFDFDFNPLAPSIESWSRMKIQRFVRSVNRTGRQQIADIITRAMEEGYTVQDISQQLADELDRTRDYRSDRIAQTEVIGTHNKGIWEALKQSGVVKTKMWISTLDERVRDSHEDAHQQEVGIDDFFKVGESQALLLFPGDSISGAPAEEIISCRCTLVAGKVET